MSDTSFDQFLAQLSLKSEEKFISPGAISWPAGLNEGGWYFSPELISIYGSEVWFSMNESQQKRLSFAEAVNFFSMNIHGEKYLISEMSRLLYVNKDLELSRYLLHFVNEEARHMMFFARFCHQYAGKIYKDRTVQFDTAMDADFAWILLFARINIFEEVIGHYNRQMSGDSKLEPIARQINRIHYIEELRHLSFGRQLLTQRVNKTVDRWETDKQIALRTQLSDYLRMVWQQFYNPDAYRDAGLSIDYDTWREIAASDRSRVQRETINRKRLPHLRSLGILEDL